MTLETTAGRPVSFPSLRPVATSRLADEVVEQIRSLIVENDLSEGTRLPSERELAQLLGTSRPIIAQALRLLSVMGLVDIRPGSGAYVLRQPGRLVAHSIELMLDMESGTSAQLLELRFGLESTGILLAIQRATSEDLQRVEQALNRMIHAPTPSAWVAADAVFHSELIRTSGNAYLSGMFDAVHTVAVSRVYDSWISSGTAPEWLQSTESRPNEVHVKILEALREHDTDALTTAINEHHLAMEEHLSSV